MRDSIDKGKPQSAIGNFVTDLCLTYVEADICIMNNGGLRTNISKGNITRGKSEVTEIETASEIHQIIIHAARAITTDAFSSMFSRPRLREFKKIKDQKIKIDNQEIKEIITVNGVRFSFEDGSWGLIRASSNKPSLVVVTESPSSEERKKKIFDFIDGLLQKTGKIGEYDQKI